MKKNKKINKAKKMKEIVVATTNEHKLREIRQILKGVRVRGEGVKVRENGKTFKANAIKKVKTLKLKEGEVGIADDSGLMVNALGGRPGVRSARFATPPTAENLCRKLLCLMKNKKNRAAKFVCVIAVAYPNGKIRTVKGVCPGRIAGEMMGERGFGYDPVFLPRGDKKTFAQLSALAKNRLSHRGRALQKLRTILLR